MDIQLPQHNLLKRLFFPHLNGLGKLVKDQLTIDTWVCFWTTNSFSLNMSILMSLPHCLDFCCFVVSFETRKCESSNFVLFQYHFGYLGLLEIPYEFEDQLFDFCKKELLEF